ncbi:MAG: hypothetical protein WC844_05285 [Patescibacteria group bacterium]|jgi:hypothetical protein
MALSEAELQQIRINDRYQVMQIQRRLITCPQCRGNLASLDIKINRDGTTHKVPIYAVSCEQCRIIFIFPPDKNE